MISVILVSITNAQIVLILLIVKHKQAHDLPSAYALYWQQHINEYTRWLQSPKVQHN
jgi:hypothetical protein